MTGLVCFKHLFLFFLLCLAGFEFGCGGGGGSQGTVPPPQNPLPTLTGVTPTSAAAGSPVLTLTASGSNFVRSSVVEWNGAALATTYVSSTSLSAQVPASDLSTAGAATVVVETPAPGGGTSAALHFTIQSASTMLSVLDVEGTDLVWNATQQKLYVAVPSSATSNPATITVVDPVGASIGAAQPLSSAPSGFAISDDNQYLYAVINGGSAIQRFTLPALSPDIQWSLGTDPVSGNPNLAGDIKVQPGAAHTLAVSLGPYGSGSVAVFDDSLQRPGTAGTLAAGIGNSLQWTSDGSQLFAAYTLINASPYYTTVSDDALYAIAVTASGASSVTTYDSSFRQEGAHLHYDATTGNIYGDWGEVINGTTGIPVGNYRYSKPFSTFFPGPLSVVDASLNRFYTLLETNEPDGSQAFQLQAFDQTQFKLLSTIVIPNAVGQPVNFIRWGQAGLAFITNGGSNGTGKLYILDGAFVSPSGTPDTSAGVALTPVPTLAAVSPLTATVGSGSLTLNLTGHDFSGQTTVYWNGNALPTTFVNNTQVSVLVPASDFGSAAQAVITASNSGGPSPGSNSLSFSINSPPPTGNQVSVYSAGGDDLVWDPNASRIYVAMPGIQGDSGDTVATVDPVTGGVTYSGFLGSDPARLSLTGNSQYLYVALYGQNAVQQLTVPNFNVNASWNLGSAGAFQGFHGPYFALDLQSAPGAPQTTAIVLANFDISPSAEAVSIYDGAIPRASPLQVTGYPYSSLQWAGNSTSLYAVDQYVPQDFLTLGVNASGASLTQHYNGLVSPYSPGIHYDPGTSLVYSDGGQVIEPANGTVVGNYGSSGIAVPDSTLGRVFILGQTAVQAGTPNYTIDAFDQTNFTALGSITINNVVGTPTALIRWGTDGLAFTSQIGAPTDFLGTGPGQLYVISGTFVNPAGRTNQSSENAQSPPLQRTWNLNSTSRRPPRTLIERSPIAR